MEGIKHIKVACHTIHLAEWNSLVLSNEIEEAEKPKKEESIMDLLLCSSSSSSSSSLLSFKNPYRYLNHLDKEIVNN
jgi:hypothetical protein